VAGLIVLASLANVSTSNTPATGRSPATPTPGHATKYVVLSPTPSTPKVACPPAGCPVQNVGGAGILSQIWYGQVPPGGAEARVLVFGHGLTGIAQDWWGNTDLSGINDMYLMAYNAGYRTAFVTLQADGLRGPDYTIEQDGQYLYEMLVEIALNHYHV